MHRPLTIREARPDEHPALGQLLVCAYSTLEGFPTPVEQPRYYAMLRDVGALASQPATKLLVATASSAEAASSAGEPLLGGVVSISDMAHYGAGGVATAEKDASGFRLLATAPGARGQGVGKALVLACIDEARARGHRQVILHTTRAMRVAWGMYERLGFERSPDLDFDQEGLSVFGFRRKLAR
jgi:GNAT superfamily N-acetyltransferase